MVRAWKCPSLAPIPPFCVHFRLTVSKIPQSRRKGVILSQKIHKAYGDKGFEGVFGLKMTEKREGLPQKNAKFY